MGRGRLVKWFVAVLAMSSVLVVIASQRSSKRDTDRDAEALRNAMPELTKSLDDMLKPRPEVSRPAVARKVLSSLVTPDEAKVLTANKRHLLDALPDTSLLNPPMRVATVMAKDPNGDLKAGPRWYEPKVVRTECNVTIDASPVPTVAAIFVPGDPNLLTQGDLRGQAMTLEAPFVFSAELQLFDDQNRRDQMLSAMIDVVSGPLLENCSVGKELVGTVRQVAARPLGVKRYAFTVDGLMGKQEGSLVAVGTKGILRLGAGSIGFGGLDGKKRPMGADTKTVEALSVATVKAVEASGLVD